MGTTLHELERIHGADLAAEDYWAQARLSILRDWVDTTHPERVLDLGCGSGYLSEALAHDGRQVIGLDIDPESIAVARKRETPAEFMVGDATDLAGTIQPATVDTVILADVIEHFEDPVPVLEEAGRVVKADGRVVISVPAHEWLFGPHDSNQGHARRYSPDALGDAARAAGLQSIRYRFTNFFPLPAYLLFQRILHRDVPESVRGQQSSRLLTLAKKALLATERTIRFPTGVTLLGEFTPARQGVGETVLLTNYEYPPACGGGGVFTRDLRSSLRARGWEVELVAGRNHSALRPNGVLDLMAYPFTSARRLGRVIRRVDPDVLNGHFSVPSSLLLPYFKRRYGTPYVVNVMGADIHDPTRYDRLRPLLDQVNYRLVLQHADAIVAPSEDMARRLPARFREKLAVIPYYVDTDRFTPASEGEIFGGGQAPAAHDPLRLLTVARLVPRKNLISGLETLVCLISTGVDATYTIVGDGSQRAQLEHKARSLGLTPYVSFEGYVPDADLPGVYRDHDIFVLPSHHEAFGIVILEAMASGLPVLTSALGGQTDIVTSDTGATVGAWGGQAMNPEKAAEAIWRIAAEYPRYANQARRRVEEHFSEETVVGQYQELYSEVARR